MSIGEGSKSEGNLYWKATERNIDMYLAYSWDISESPKSKGKSSSKGRKGWKQSSVKPKLSFD